MSAKLQKEGYIMENFLQFIFDIIDYIRAIVAYYRAKNDGKEAEMPEFPSFVKTE